MATLVEIVTALAAVEEAQNAYAALTDAAGYGYRDPEDDVRLLGWFSDHEDELKVTPSEAFELALKARESASPYDDRGFIHQGVEDERADVAERIGARKPMCASCYEYVDAIDPDDLCADCSDPAAALDHDARPDDDPSGEDRCKTCGASVTWMGPGPLDWAHV